MHEKKFTENSDFKIRPFHWSVFLKQRYDFYKSAAFMENEILSVSQKY